jgi:23S rRNA (guanosine2251-2'-O)-methyltransferase
MVPIYVALENIRSAFNVGSFFRTCDSAGVAKLFLTGFTAVPPHPKIDKTALGSVLSVPWEHHCDLIRLIKELQAQQVEIIALENTKAATSLYEISTTKSACLIFGNEESGVSQEVIKHADKVVKIPQFGIKESLNVSVAGGIAIYEWRRKTIEIK